MRNSLRLLFARGIHLHFMLIITMIPVKLKIIVVRLYCNYKNIIIICAKNKSARKIELCFYNCIQWSWYFTWITKDTYNYPFKRKIIIIFELSSTWSCVWLMWFKILWEWKLFRFDKMEMNACEISLIGVTFYIKRGKNNNVLITSVENEHNRDQWLKG